MISDGHKGIKRRSRVAFSNDNSFLRLAISILMDINEEWIPGMKYLTQPGSFTEANVKVVILHLYPKSSHYGRG